MIAFALVGSSATTAAAEPQPDPLARNYVDLGVHGGALLRGSLADARFNPIGYGFGATVDFGRAPFWGGAYVDVDFFGAESGVLDPYSGRPPSLVITSAGWRGKMAVRLGRAFYFFPALGAGFGIAGYRPNGPCSGTLHPSCGGAEYHGFGIQADAVLAYRWRFGALTLEPIRFVAFLGEHPQDGRPASSQPGGYGISARGAALGAGAGLTLDLSAMVLAVRDAIEAGIAAVRF